MNHSDVKSMTNGAGVKDWLEATKGWNIDTSITSQLPNLTEGISSAEQGQVFTKAKFDEALKKVSRRIKK